MNTIVKMLMTLTIVGIISGGLLSQISNWAEPKIEMNRKLETERAIFLVQPDAKFYNKIEAAKFELYQVFKDEEKSESLGYALPFEGNGFQGKIRLMVGVKNDLKELVGLEVLEQVETPGLGTKVTEKPFTNQFNGLSAEPEINWTKGEASKKNSEIQTITGATISSKAVVAIINNGLSELRSTVQNGEAR